MSTRAVFFDLLGTVALFLPEQEELLVASAATQGIAMTLQDARRGFAISGDWWNRQLIRQPLAERTQDEKNTLYREFDQRVMQAAGFDLSEEQAFQIFRELMRRARGSRLAIYNDVIPAFKALQGRDIKLGIISNVGRQLPQLLDSVGLTGYLTTVVSQGEVGVGKPSPGIFVAALERAHLAPEEAIYVGDQFENDVVGARGAGLLPILLDRYDLFPDVTDCLRVNSLEAVRSHLMD